MCRATHPTQPCHLPRRPAAGSNKRAAGAPPATRPSSSLLPDPKDIQRALRMSNVGELDMAAVAATPMGAVGSILQLPPTALPRHVAYALTPIDLATGEPAGPSQLLNADAIIALQVLAAIYGAAAQVRVPACHVP